ncbi:copper-binding protein [Cupriavidus sp. LEh21]|nr:MULTISPECIES: copper-binding protein [unclassified Cupriavidus]MDK2655023.1 copper-binding protein [Cupriavidus sp. LEh21]
MGMTLPARAANMDGMDMKPASGTTKAPQPVPAEVRKIDAANGKITLKHGPIANLGMSAMTMAFPVRDAAMLKGLKEGDQVSVTFDTIDGKPSVVDLRK